ncbi:ABC transporter ATP-binding protein [Sinorhizobium sp. BG8]|uniref:ABC transporter ATP-binding protein n=1 Tax=Sinorhizobium sp. BG8 TaxID=2613773 RepID=UPI00193EB7D8|nr:ABC transporter ATP-binding protein [Sinorhizobium sp. BG8]QRM57910.1 ABC transporter ATP-binding protein [Sinorhizobium sp. BG8]QRM57982.1 ABC transporter ATP-binding protein [Sinorhizobium sp. BG8]
MLRVHELTKRFGQAVALNSVSFGIEPGTIHGLIGPNGSGKTTFFNVTTGFLAPTAGRVMFKDMDITGMPSHKIARLGIARTFQNTSNYANLSVRENLVTAARNRIETSWLANILGLRSARTEEEMHRKSADAILERFGMREFASSLACDLPGGTQKILGVAIAFSTAPRLLMLDEPLAGLNSGEKVRLMEIIRGLRDDGMTLLLIEHDMKAIMQACDRITVLCYGDLLAEGTPAEVSRNPATIQAYLGEEAA